MGKHAENRRQKYLNEFIRAGDVVASSVLPYTAARDGHRHLPRGADHRDRIHEPYRPRLQGRDRDGPPSHSPWRGVASSIVRDAPKIDEDLRRDLSFGARARRIHDRADRAAR